MNKPYRNENGELCLEFGDYFVIQKKRNFNAIYKHGYFVTHTHSWKRSTKLAKMLNQAYREGYSDGYDINSSW